MEFEYTESKFLIHEPFIFKLQHSYHDNLITCEVLAVPTLLSYLNRLLHYKRFTWWFNLRVLAKVNFKVPSNFS